MADEGKGRSWPAQLAIAAVPALITGYFSYQIATMEAGRDRTPPMTRPRRRFG